MPIMPYHATGRSQTTTMVSQSEPQIFTKLYFGAAQTLFGLIY